MDKSDSERMQRGRPLVLYDGECGLCARSVQFVLERDRAGRFCFAALQSDLGRAVVDRAGGDPEQLDSMVLRDERDRVHFKSGAALRVAARLPWPWRAAAVGLLVPPLLRDAIYDFVARRRLRWFGTAESCRLPRAGESSRFLS